MFQGRDSNSVWLAGLGFVIVFGGCGEVATSSSHLEEASQEVRGSPVIPPDRQVEGHTQGEWLGRWWHWAFQTQWTGHPLRFPDGGDCSGNQSGEVWFLGGVFFENGATPPPAISRDCTVPSGTILNVNIIDAEASTAAGDNCGDTSDAALIACAKSFNDNVAAATVEIDGASVDLGDPLTGPFRLASGAFNFRAPSDNIYVAFGLAVPAGRYRSAANGIHIMLRPLPEGLHVLHFFARTTDGFTMDITYHLSVED